MSMRASVLIAIVLHDGQDIREAREIKDNFENSEEKEARNAEEIGRRARWKKEGGTSRIGERESEKGMREAVEDGTYE